MLECLQEPAFVVSELGLLLAQNAPAQQGFARPPRWLASAARPDRARHLRGLARVVPMAIDGRKLLLVLPLANPHGRRVELPPWLEKVAALLVEGRTDKQIAAALELKLTTVRTGVARVYRRTGVRSRAELAKRAKALGLADGAEPPSQGRRG